MPGKKSGIAICWLHIIKEFLNRVNAELTPNFQPNESYQG